MTNPASKKFPRLFQNFGIGKDLDYLTENLGLLLGAGVDISTALTSIKGNVETARMKEIIDEMSADLAAGTPLSETFKKTRLFPRRVSSLILIGEQTGQLVKNFKMIAEQEEKQRSFRAKIQTALLYPGFVFGITIAVGIGVSWFILPRLATLFAQLKLELPFITKMLLSFGMFLSKHGATALPVFLLGMVALIYFLFFFPGTKRLGEYVLFSFPGVNRLLTEVELARFGFTLGGLLKSGVPILEAFSSLEDSTNSERYKGLYAHMRKKLATGESFADSFRTFRKVGHLIPGPIQQLLITGSASGSLAETFTKIGKIFEEKSDVTTRNLGVILEPILLFIVWIAAVSVALAVILPIYNLIGGINRA